MGLKWKGASSCLKWIRWGFVCRFVFGLSYDFVGQEVLLSVGVVAVNGGLCLVIGSI